MPPDHGESRLASPLPMVLASTVAARLTSPIAEAIPAFVEILCAATGASIVFSRVAPKSAESEG